MSIKRTYLVDGEKISHDDYLKTKYEDLRIRVPKGKKADIQSHVSEIPGKSLNAFVNEAIDEKMERDTKKADE